MLFGAFDIVVRRPCRPGDHIDCIISSRPLIHGTWHIQLAPSSDTAAATGCRHYARGGVFVVHSVVDDDEVDTIQSLLHRGGVFVVCFVVDDEDNMNSILLATNMVFLS